MAVFSHGRLRLYLLKLLDDGPKHGYELIRLLENRFHGHYAPSAGTIYPRLARLEAEGQVTHTVDRGRKIYALTDAGRAELRDRQRELAALEADIRASVRDLAGDPVHRVRRRADTQAGRDLKRAELRRADSGGPVPGGRVRAGAAAAGPGRGRRAGGLPDRLHRAGARTAARRPAWRCRGGHRGRGAGDLAGRGRAHAPAAAVRSLILARSPGRSRSQKTFRRRAGGIQIAERQCAPCLPRRERRDCSSSRTTRTSSSCSPPACASPGST